MAIFYVTEFAFVPDRGNKGLPMLEQPPLVASNNVVIGAGHLESNAFNPKTQAILVSCDVACEYLIGLNPVVTKDVDQRMAAGTSQVFFVQMGAGHKVSVIAPTI